MITLIHSAMMLCLIVLPLASRRKKRTTFTGKIDHDTSNAEYAINAHGFLEKISDSATSDRYID